MTPEECLAPTATEWGSSRWAEYRRCQRAHFLKYELGVTRRAPEPDDDEDERNTRIDYYAVGTLVHACLAYTSAAAMVGEIADYEDVIRAAGCQAGARPPFDIGVIYETERLLSAYFARYGRENGGWPEDVKVIGVEAHLGKAPLERRADTILKLPSGEIVVADTKTRAHAIPGTVFDKLTGKKIAGPDPRFVEDMQTNDQFLGLSYLAQKEFGLEEPPSVWVNAVIKTKIPHFDRVMIPYTDRMIDRWAGEQAVWLEAFIRNRNSLANYSACAPPIGSRCSYFYWCHGSDEKRESLFEIRKEKRS